MTYNSSQQFESYVPVYDAAPETLEELRMFLVEVLKEHANAINTREIGWLLDEELLTGQQMIPGTKIAGDKTEQQFRSVLRKVIDFSPLPGGAKALPHGITVNNRFTLLHMYAAGTDASGSPAEPIPNGADTITMDATNITITTAAAYARSFCVCEYMQEL